MNLHLVSSLLGLKKRLIIGQFGMEWFFEPHIQQKWVAKWAGSIIVHSMVEFAQGKCILWIIQAPLGVNCGRIPCLIFSINVAWMPIGLTRLLFKYSVVTGRKFVSFTFAAFDVLEFELEPESFWSISVLVGFTSNSGLTIVWVVRDVVNVHGAEKEPRIR